MGSVGESDGRALRSRGGEGATGFSGWAAGMMGDGKETWVRTMRSTPALGECGGYAVEALGGDDECGAGFHGDEERWSAVKCYGAGRRFDWCGFDWRIGLARDAGGWTEKRPVM